MRTRLPDFHRQSHESRVTESLSHRVTKSQSHRVTKLIEQPNISKMVRVFGTNFESFTERLEKRFYLFSDLKQIKSGKFTSVIPIQLLNHAILPYFSVKIEITCQNLKILRKRQFSPRNFLESEPN